MKKATVRIFSIMLMATLSQASIGTESIDAMQTIQAFYKKYLNYDYNMTPDLPRPKLGFSQSFKSAIKRNEEVCKNYATGICGWDSQGDEYLNTQEVDPLLNYENSRIKYRRLSSSSIEVSFNVYPSDSEDIEYYNRVITFFMIKEGNEWVADDIHHGSSSARERIESENAEYIANPDPDSIFAKKSLTKQ